jgi:glycosyltransferase involved in cell wall biosynthesis
VLKHEVFDTHEIYRLPYQRTLRDKLNDFPNNAIARFLRKLLTFVDLIFNNFFLISIPYANFYGFTKLLIEKSPNKYKLLIATGRPFQLFFIAHQLKKRLDIKWLADYRDEWNTFQYTENLSILQRFIGKLEARSEKKWVQNSEGIIAVSDHWQNSIAKYVNKPGHLVMNGFADDTVGAATPKHDNNKLEISYIGTLYSIQNIALVVDAIKQIIIQYRKLITIKINFIGIEVMPGQRGRIEELISGYTEYFFIYERMPKQKLNVFYSHSDLLLATGFEGIKGWYPVKLFEYCKTGVPILLCPSDSDVMEKLVTSLNAGYLANNKDECIAVLTKIIQHKLSGNPLILTTNQNKLFTYSREYQTKILSTILDQC